jgi:Mrp family chromosome partitioning ATPase
VASTLHKVMERARAPGATAPRRQAAPARFEAEMRALRSQLQPLLDERKPCVLAITACNPGEGATTVSRELARSLALDGCKVLLCGWPGMPGAPRAVGAPPAPVRRRMGRTVIPSLCFTDISDLHRTDARNSAIHAFRDWVETVKTYFDVVLVDAPPILAQPAWGALMRSPDGVLLTMEAEQTRSVVLSTSISAIEGAGGHILGIIFNKRRQYIPELFYRWL